MKESLTSKANSVMVLSAAAATGHLRAADALVAAFAARGVPARHVEVFALPALAYKIDTLLADHGRFSRMQEAARRMARPDAASEVVSTVLKAKVRMNLHYPLQIEFGIIRMRSFPLHPIPEGDGVRDEGIS